MRILPIVLGIGAALSSLAWLPQRPPASAGMGQVGQPLGKKADALPAEVALLSVASWDDSAKAGKEFKVQFSKGTWTIPSHWNYPADGGDRVGKLAGALLGVPRGRLVTSDTKLHEQLGVLDPLEQGVVEGKGRGKRVTMRSGADALLLDLIIGERAEDGDGRYYVREADSNEVYTAKVSPYDITTKFADWVKPDLLQVKKEDITEVSVRDFSIDITGTSVDTIIKKRGEATFTKAGEDWNAKDVPAGKVVNKAEVDKVLSELTWLRLTGIRPMEPALLTSRGYYLVPHPAFTAQPGMLKLQTPQGVAALLPNEGELAVTTKDGLRYRLMFGQIAQSDEEDQKKPEERKDAGKPEGAKDGAKPAETKDEQKNRYVVVFVQYDPEADTTAKKDEPKKEGDATAKAEGEQKKEEAKAEEKKDPEGKAKADKAMKRFFQFFYVVSDGSFQKLRPDPKTLFKDEPMAGSTGKTNKQWLADNKKQDGIVETASGLQYKVLTAAKPDAKQPKDGERVKVKYRGTLVDGKQFDATTGDETREFGVNEVVKGWTEALKLMRVGDKWQLFIPPDIGYGEGGKGDIPANAILIFEVELVEVL